MKKPLVILAGPTAVGKTTMSLQLAKAINGEIISADSMQVYQGLDIGSAKIKKEEMQGVPHHLIDILQPHDAFHVVQFQQLARKAMTEIYERNHIPIIAGGTGFYIQALAYDIDFTKDKQDYSYRHTLRQLLEMYGGEYLHNMLFAVDEEAARQIHANNIKRVMRALEFYQQTGKKISEHNDKERQKESPYNMAYFVLNDSREQLYKQINRRVDQMLEEGLVDEVRKLQKEGYTKDMVSMQGLGYKEILSYLAGDMDLDTAVEILKRDTRHFAKRQLTWFKREKEVCWVDKQVYQYDEDKIVTFMLDILRERNIIQ